MRGVLNIKYDRLRELPQPRLWKAPREAGLEKVACHEMGQAVNGGCNNENDHNDETHRINSSRSSHKRL